MKSQIYLKEELQNKERKFGSNLNYYPAKVHLVDGKEMSALFTLDQIKDAMERAMRNPEDLPKEHSSFFSWLLD